MKRIFFASILILTAASCGDKEEKPQPTPPDVGANLEIQLTAHQNDPSNEFIAIFNAHTPDTTYLIINVNGENRTMRGWATLSDFSAGTVVAKPVSKAKEMFMSIKASGNSSQYTLSFLRNDTVRKTEVITIDSGVVFTKIFYLRSYE